ncbi:MAG TPA: YtxH domain-containing protein [Oceanobacillus sp.]|nr:YtxH domain-containing protein [Oceanobacillus sp.]
MNDRIYYSHEAEMRANRERAVAVMMFLALGVGIGTVLALMFAPKSGEKLRAEIARSMEDSLGRGNAFKQLSQDFSDLRKSIEDRLEMRR